MKPNSEVLLVLYSGKTARKKMAKHYIIYSVIMLLSHYSLMHHELGQAIREPLDHVSISVNKHIKYIIIKSRC